MDQHSKQRGTDFPSWRSYIGDAVSVLLMVITVAIGWGKLDERLNGLEKKVQSTDASRNELKADINEALRDIKRSIERLDDRLAIRAAPLR